MKSIIKRQANWTVTLVVGFVRLIMKKRVNFVKVWGEVKRK